MEEIEKDEIFFFHSGGGVTVSGGEALLQPEFVKELLQECCMRGIETAIETSFFAEFSTNEKLLPYLGSLYVDLKCMEEERHKLLTGVSNKKIHDNLRRFSTLKNRPRLHIRIPLIPDWNSDDNNLRESAQFCSQLNYVEDIELLAYHRLGTKTYEKIGKKYELKDVNVPDKIFMDQCASVVREVCRSIPNAI